MSNKHSDNNKKKSNKQVQDPFLEHKRKEDKYFNWAIKHENQLEQQKPIKANNEQTKEENFDDKKWETAQRKERKLRLEHELRQKKIKKVITAIIVIAILALLITGMYYGWFGS